MLQKEELNWSINGNLRHLKYEYKNIGNALEKYNAQNRKDETDQKIGSSNLNVIMTEEALLISGLYVRPESIR